MERRDGRWTHFDWKDDQNNYIRGDTTIDGNTSINGITSLNGNTSLKGTVSLGDQPLRFRAMGDGNHGIQWSNNKSIDGPSLWGNAGGGLGTVSNKDSITWNAKGDLNVSGTLCVQNQCINGDALRNIIETAKNAVRKDKEYGIRSSKVGGNNNFMRVDNDTLGRFAGGKGDWEKVKFDEY